MARIHRTMLTAAAAALMPAAVVWTPHSSLPGNVQVTAHATAVQLTDAVSNTTVPDVTGDTPQVAGAAMQAADLSLDQFDYTLNCPVPADGKTHVISTEPVPGAVVPTGTSVRALVCDAVQVPNVIGDNVTFAFVQLVNAGLNPLLGTTANCDLNQQDLVVATYPQQRGAVVHNGATIDVYECYITSEPVPSVIGESLSQATADIQAAGLTLGSVGTTTSCDVPAGTVATESPFSGDFIPLGSPVDLRTSTGPPRTPCN